MNNSNLPISIVKDNIHLAAFGRTLKFESGPITDPKPGPTFDIAEAAAEKEVKKSKLKKLRDIAAKININIYIKKKPIIELKVSSVTVCPLKEVTKTPCGCVSFLI